MTYQPTALGPSATIDTTQSLCPRCLKFVPAEIFMREGKVFMRKECDEHGAAEALLHSDAAQYLAGRRDDRRFSHPSKLEESFGSPSDLPPPQGGRDTRMSAPSPLLGEGWGGGDRYDLRTTPEQAVCVVLIDVTDACNLRCPTCFAAAEGHNFLSLAEFERALDAALTRKPDLDWLQLSGGEPTIHPQILDLVKLAQDRGVRVVQINTNGVRLARDDEFLAALSKLKPAIYLSFDTFRPSVYQELRGANLVDLKLKAVARLAAVGVATTLLCTVQRGLNEDELGDLVRFGMNHPSVPVVAFQPTFYAGRAPQHNPLDRITNGDVLRLLEEQLGGAVAASDFVAVPCCNPACTMVTFVYQEGDTVIPLTRFINAADYEQFLQDRMIDSAISELVSGGGAMLAQGDAPC